MNAQEYNYKNFPPDMDGRLFREFPEVLHVGQEAPDGEVVVLADGSTTRLSTYWAGRPLVIEFGSFT